MPNHKRGRAKNQRAGCLLCKPHKMNGVKKRGDVPPSCAPWRGERLAQLHLQEGQAAWASLSPSERAHGEGHCGVCMELDCFCEADHPAQRRAWAWWPAGRPEAANVTPLTATLRELVA